MKKSIRFCFIGLLAIMLLSACSRSRSSSSPPPDEPPTDTTAPVIALSSPVMGENWRGTRDITWMTTDANPGTVEIRLSADSGATYPTVIAAAAPDTGTFSWDTTGVADGSTYRVRVTATDTEGNTGNPDDSPVDFVIDNTAPTIALTAADGGEVWGGTQNVTWTTTDDNPGTVEIRLSADSGVTYPTVIAAAAPDTGTFSWDTSAVADGSTYRVRVTPTDIAGNAGAADPSSADFSIDNTAPTIALTAPDGGEVWGGTRDITWSTTDDNPGTVEIRLSADSGATHPTVIAAAATDTGTFSWDTSTVADGSTYRIQVTATDAAGNAGAANASAADFAIDNTAPAIALTAPNGGEVWSDTQDIVWTTTDDNPGTVEIRLSADSGASYPTVLAAAAPDTGSFSWDTTSVVDGAAYRIRVTATDAEGNTGNSDESAASFQIDNTAPAIALTAPDSGEAWEGIRNITWTTTDANPGTVEILLSADSGATYPTVLAAAAPDSGSFAWDTSAFPDAATYRVRVTATDTQGNTGNSADSAVNFVVDNTAPAIALTAADGGEVWGGDRDITWTTTDDNPATVEIRLSADSGATYPTIIAATAPDTGTFSWDTSGVPDGAMYRVRVTATDAAGNTSTAETSAADFSIDNTAPAIALTAPDGGEVWGGGHSITWTTTDDNPATVEIRISSDSGAGYPIVLAAAATDTGSFSWNTNGTGDGATYRVQVIATDAAGNASAPDRSAADFSVDNTGPTVALTAPDGGEVWGGTRNITWTTTDDNPGTVEIRLSSDSGGTYPTVIAAAGTPDNGSFSWDTSAVVDGTNYRVQVIATDAAGNAGPDVSAADFSIDNTAPVISLTAPDGGEVWGGGNRDITWTTTDDNPGTVEIRLSADSGVSFPTVLAASAPDTGTFSWDTGAVASGTTYRVQVTATDTAGNASTAESSAADFSIDNTAPVISLTAPDGGEVWGGGNSITWTTTDDNPGTVEIRLSADSGATYPTVLAAAAPDTGNFSWNTNGAADGNTYRVQVTATDALGNASAPDASAGDFSVDNTGPTVTLTAPDGGEVWGGTRDITWTTTDENPGTVQIRLSADSGVSYPTVIAAAGTPDTGTFSWDTTAVADGTTYRVQVIATDAAGNAGPDVSAADFSIDNTAPSVALTAPDGGEVWDGTRNITWTTTDDNPDTVEIRLSSDSGGSYPTQIAAAAPDTGTFSWDTATVADATTYRIRVTPTDTLGQTGTADESAADFTVDNAPPTVSGFARYVDENANGVADAGDTLVVPFDRDVVVNGATDTDFALPVTGDDLGTGATVAAGPAANEVTITLGASPSLKSRQTFDVSNTASNDPSGIDVSVLIAADAIENTAGFDAVPSTSIDIIPAYLDGGQVLGNASTRSIALGDVDADGDLDAVAGNESMEPNRIWFNDGSGTFTDSGQLLGASFTQAVALGDVDSDGDLDFVAGNTGNQANLVWLNDGTGTFTDSGPSLGSSSTTSVAFGDVDSDGDLDFVAGNGSNQANRVWLNDGAGGFTDSGQTLGSNPTNFVALGDLDGDGDLDFAAGNGTGLGQPNRVYFNDGAGTFADSGQSIGNNRTHHFALGDVDADGDLDMLTGNRGGESNRVWLNDGTGTFADSGQILGSDDTWDVTVGDVDSDGDLDIVNGNTFNQPDRVWLNDGSGNFTDSGMSHGSNPSTATLGVPLGDIDADGDLDIVAARTNHVYFNSLSGTWGASTFADSGQSLGANFTSDVALGDVDSDGDTDLVTANYAGQANRVWLNDGAGTLTDTGQTLGAGSTFATKLNDVDSDGDLDILAGNAAANRVFLNDGSGTFADSGQALGALSWTSAIAMGDVDGDGDDDIVAGNGASLTNQPNLVWLNDGAGNFTDSGQALGNDATLAVALQDVDRDGDLDLIVGNTDSQANEIWFNDGAGVFTDSGQTLGSSRTSAIAMADVDRDGDDDMVAGNGISGTDEPNLVWLNDGAGTFTDSGQTLGNAATYAVALQDVDGDGDADLIVGNYNSQANEVWLNDGAGNFTDSGQTLGNFFTRGVALDDVDSDGDPDIVTGNDGEGNKVWLNE